MSTQPVPQPDQFQYIKLPDGSYGKFAADASDDVIKSAISKDFPSAFQQPTQHGAFVRFMSRATGIPEDAFTQPNRYFNPFSAAYNSPEQRAVQQSLAPNSDEQIQNPSSLIPGRQTIQDIKSGNYAGAAGDVTPGIIAFLQMRGARMSQPEVLPPQRTLALPPAPREPIPLGASSIEPAAPQSEGVLPAARQVVRDANTGQLRDQYTTSVASPNQSPYSIVGAKNLKVSTALDDLQGYKQNQMVQQVRDLMERQDGVGAAEADARMADYAKKPWENEKTSVTVPEKVTVGSAAGSEQDTALFQKARSILGPNASISQIAQLAQKFKTGVVAPGNGIPADAAVPQEAAAYMPEVVNNSSNLSELLKRSIQIARSRK